MKRVIILSILLFVVSYLYAEQDTLSISDTLTAEEICLRRGHNVLVYYLYREGKMPYFVDYADSSVLYYYENNIETGKLYYCERCKSWIGVPIFDEPKKRITWRRKKISKKTKE